MLNHCLQKYRGMHMQHVALILDALWSMTPRCLAHCKQIAALNVANLRLEGTLTSLCRNKEAGIPLQRIDSRLWNLCVAPPVAKRMAFVLYSLVDALGPVDVCLKFEASDI